MTSIREQILLAVMAAVRPTAEGLGATVHRSPTVAIGREQCPALVVFPESDSITERANDRVTRELTVRIVALARAVPPVAPETEADEQSLAQIREAFAASEFHIQELLVALTQTDAFRYRRVPGVWKGEEQ